MLLALQVGAAFDRLGAQDRCAHQQLGQVDIQIAAEEPRPRATGHHDALTTNRAVLGHDRANPAAAGFNAARGAGRQNLDAAFA
ncbi:hypothetical protein GGD41_006403 [Paraburkholderia bryophila]|uniref:Uncharacterized protein n=1 Tax=Paraburkholderia bryophila TaxID=420952 RepID=A0A7Z0B3Z3_9BURK|nr:hypothetical protein [Paraburkholderia bryophila]